jgi:phage terminase large subunit-like protein
VSNDDETEGKVVDLDTIRRHAQKMLSRAERRRLFSSLDFYKPDRKQLELHCSTAREVMFRSASQVGKSKALAAEVAMHATQQYPPWYKGRKFLKAPKLQRPYSMVIWVGSTTQLAQKQQLQLLILGDITAPRGSPSGLGTGTLPLDSIVKVVPARGVADLVDAVVVKREDGTLAIIRFKTYATGRELWQGEAADLIAIDEDCSTKTGDPIYPECIARLQATGGIIRVALTPRPGRSELYKRFYPGAPGTAHVEGTYLDALVSAGGHIDDARKAELESMYPEHERRTRLYGEPMMGEASVFSMQPDEIAHDVSLQEAMAWPQLRWMWGFDFNHGGTGPSAHPFAAVLVCHDTDGVLGQGADCILVMHAFKVPGLPPAQIAQLKSHPLWRQPIAYPHDAGKGSGLQSGDTIKQFFKKLEAGLNFRPQFAAI